MDARKALLVDAYRRFNGRDVDGLLSMMTDDVEWPDVPNQAVLRSKDAIRQYWLGEFAVTDPQMVPTEFVPGGAEDEIVAVVEQEVRDLSGAVLVDRREMRHRYSFRDGLVRRMVVEYVESVE
jgi:ketosteroid isomerase-like protein